MSSMNLRNASLILDNYGGERINNLLNIISLHNDENQTDLFKDEPSFYYSINEMKAFIEHHHNHLKILSFNSRSILAKMDKLLALVDDLAQTNLFFDAICIQECWLTPNFNENLVQLPGYKAFIKTATPECSSKGGLITYILKSHASQQIINPNDTNTWEGLFVSLNQSNIICNIYRPPMKM